MLRFKYPEMHAKQTRIDVKVNFLSLLYIRFPLKIYAHAIYETRITHIRERNTDLKCLKFSYITMLRQCYLFL